MSPETAEAALTALTALTCPDKRAESFASLVPKAQARFAREHIQPIVRVLTECADLTSLPAEEGWDLNKLAGIATGVARYDRAAAKTRAKQRDANVREYRELEEERLCSRAGLTCFGRGLALNAVTDLRHTECMEAKHTARTRGPMRAAPRAVQKVHRVWFDAPLVREGFEVAVGVAPHAYLSLPRSDEEDRELAAELDEAKIKYYRECVLRLIASLAQPAER